MTATTTPPEFASVNSPLIWVVNDDNAIDPTLLNYKYVGELWVAGVKVYTERAHPRPNGAFGLFDFASVLRNYIVPTLAPVAGVIAQQNVVNTFRTLDVVVQIREEYNGTLGPVVLTDTDRYFFNHFNDRPDILTSISSYQNKICSTRSKYIEISELTTNYYLPFFSTTTAAFNVSINGIVTTFTPAVVNACALINIALPSVATYDVIITLVSSGAVLATYKVNTVCKGLYRNYVVHFLNKFGAFESMLFNKVSRRRKILERKEFKQQPYRIDNTGVVSYDGVGNVRHEQRVNFVTRTDEKLSIQTDFVSDENYLWLAELVSSPQVYLEDAGVVYPVIITDSSYEYREYIVDKLTTLKVELDFTGTTNTQYR